SSAIILKKRIWGSSSKLSVSLDAARFRNGNLSLVPVIKPTIGGEPNASGPVGKNGPYDRRRHSLLHRKSWDGIVAKAIKAAIRGGPNIAFAIFKESANIFGGKAIGQRKLICPSLVQMQQPVGVSSDPQAAVPIAENPSGRKFVQKTWKRIRLGFSVDEPL